MQKVYEPVKDVVIDLDLPPEERWVQGALKFKTELKGLGKKLKEAGKEVGKKRLGEMVREWERMVKELGVGDAVDEVKGIAKTACIEYQLMVLAQMQYELAVAGCTSILLRAGKCPVISRTCDWDSSLSPLVINAVFIKNGVQQATVPTFLGMVGFITATDLINEYTVAVNHRPQYGKTLNTDSEVTHALQRRWVATVKAIKSSRKMWPVASLVRKIILDNVICEEKAVKMLESSDLIAPAYFLLASRSSGYVVTRGTTTFTTETLPSAPWSYLVKCNHDSASYQDASSLERHEAAVLQASSIQEEISRPLPDRSGIRKTAVKLSFEKFASQSPVLCEDETAYYTFSSPGWESHLVKKRRMQ